MNSMRLIRNEKRLHDWLMHLGRQHGCNISWKLVREGYDHPVVQFTKPNGEIVETLNALEFA